MLNQVVEFHPIPERDRGSRHLYLKQWITIARQCLAVYILMLFLNATEWRNLAQPVRSCDDHPRLYSEPQPCSMALRSAAQLCHACRVCGTATHPSAVGDIK